jgi:hypothetical protein
MCNCLSLPPEACTVSDLSVHCLVYRVCCAEGLHVLLLLLVQTS